MLSDKDIAIKENILKPHHVQTFFKYVYIPKSDDAIVADSIEDFMIQITDPCHLWQGRTNKDGYGVLTVYSKGARKKSNKLITVQAHRYAYAYAYGFDALPVGLETGDRDVLNHLCFTRNCVNPNHLEVISQAENLSKKKRKKYIHAN
jgi:hypothetical protein